MHCPSSLRLPTKDRVPCTLKPDHLTSHACVVYGHTILVWGMDDEGKGLVTGGALAPLFPNGSWDVRDVA